MIARWAAVCGSGLTLLVVGAGQAAAAPAGPDSRASGAGEGVSPASPQAEALRLFAARLDAASLDQAIAAFAEAAGRSAADPEPRLGRARAELFWADLHTEAQSEDLILHLSRGLQAAREGLRLASPGYTEAARRSAALPQALSAVEPGGAPALYWVAACQHRLAAARGLAALLVEVDDLRRLFARVVELAPGAVHGAAYLHLAALALALPAGFSSSLASAAQALGQAERWGPNDLQTPLLWAERWAVKAQDYLVFKRKLQQVLDAPADADPDLAADNALAKRRAEALLRSAPLLFTRTAMQRGDTAVLK